MLICSGWRPCPWCPILERRWKSQRWFWLLTYMVKTSIWRSRRAKDKWPQRSWSSVMFALFNGRSRERRRICWMSVLPWFGLRTRHDQFHPELPFRQVPVKASTSLRDGLFPPVRLSSQLLESCCWITPSSSWFRRLLRARLWSLGSSTPTSGRKTFASWRRCLPSRICPNVNLCGGRFARWRLQMARLLLTGQYQRGHPRTSAWFRP